MKEMSGDMCWKKYIFLVVFFLPFVAGNALAAKKGHECHFLIKVVNGGTWTPFAGCSYDHHVLEQAGLPTEMGMLRQTFSERGGYRFFLDDRPLAIKDRGELSGLYYFPKSGKIRYLLLGAAYYNRQSPCREMYWLLDFTRGRNAVMRLVKGGDAPELFVLDDSCADDALGKIEFPAGGGAIKLRFDEWKVGDVDPLTMPAVNYRYQDGVLTVDFKDNDDKPVHRVRGASSD